MKFIAFKKKVIKTRLFSNEAHRLNEIYNIL